KNRGADENDKSLLRRASQKTGGMVKTGFNKVTKGFKGSTMKNLFGGYDDIGDVNNISTVSSSELAKMKKNDEIGKVFSTTGNGEIMYRMSVGNSNQASAIVKHLQS